MPCGVCHRCNDPRGLVGPNSLAVCTSFFFCACFTSFYIHSPLILPSSSVVLSYFILAIPMCETLIHELHISDSHAEYILAFFVF